MIIQSDRTENIFLVGGEQIHLPMFSTMLGGGGDNYNRSSDGGVSIDCRSVKSVDTRLKSFHVSFGKRINPYRDRSFIQQSIQRSEIY
jgi:hypothetical protein